MTTPATPPPVNYSSTVPAERTIGRVHAMLAQHGAQVIATRYEAGRATGLSFQLVTATGLHTFALPVDVPAMQALLGRARKTNSRVRVTAEQAERSAWKIIQDWVGAQLAIVAAGQADMDQVMLPYLMVDTATGTTMFDAYRENTLQRALTAGDRT